MTDRQEGNKKFQDRSFGRQVALQLLYQEEMNPGTAQRFSDDFIHDELGRFSQQLNPSNEESAQELQAIREQLVNEDDDIECNLTISHDEFRELVAFVRTLVNGTLEYRDDVDLLIAEASRNWALSRMAAIDRNIIRLAVYEMKYEHTPRPVVIHEAIELGKKFGSRHSVGFINGVLDTIGKKISDKPSALD